MRVGSCCYAPILATLQDNSVQTGKLSGGGQGEIGSMIPRFTKRWSVAWHGLTIEVENWWDLLLRGGERMLINGQVVVEHTSWLSAAADLAVELVIDGETRRLDAHIGSINLGFAVGCLIRIDGMAIGGDTHKAFLT